MLHCPQPRHVDFLQHNKMDRLIKMPTMIFPHPVDLCGFTPIAGLAVVL